MSTLLGIALIIYAIGAIVTLVLAVAEAVAAKDYVDSPHIGKESREDLRRALTTIKGGFLLWPLLAINAFRRLEDASREKTKEDQ